MPLGSTPPELEVTPGELRIDVTRSAPTTGGGYAAATSSSAGSPAAAPFALEVSPGELKFDLARLPDNFPTRARGKEGGGSTFPGLCATLVLRHLGRTDDCISFTVKTAHRHRYLVRPNRGNIAPKSTASVLIILLENSRRSLLRLHEQLGDVALDFQSEMLLIESRAVSSSGVDSDKLARDDKDAVAPLKDDDAACLCSGEENAGALVAESDAPPGDTTYGPVHGTKIRVRFGTAISSTCPAKQSIGSMSEPLGSILTLRHPGGTKGCIAFKIKTTKPNGYEVKPSMGIIAPNVTKEVSISMVESERRKLLQTFHSLGGDNVDIPSKDAFLVQSRLVSGDCLTNSMSPAEVDRAASESSPSACSKDLAKALNEAVWSSNLPITNKKVRVCHARSPSSSGSGGISPVSHPRLPPSYPSTDAVRACWKEVEEEEENRGGCARGMILLGFIVGGYASMFFGAIVGTIPLIAGLNSLLKILLTRGELASRLKNFAQSGVDVEGRVVKRERKVDDISGRVSYCVQLEYDGSVVMDVESEEGGSRLHVTEYSSLVHGAKELFEMTEGSSSVSLKVAPGQPRSGIPAFLLYRKVNVIQFWSRYLHPATALLGVPIYLVLDITVLALADGLPGAIVVFGAIISILMLVPFYMIKVRQESRFQMKLLVNEPASIVTENDLPHLLLDKLGPSPSRKAKLILAIAGAFTALVQSPPGFFILVLGMVPLTSLWFSSRWRHFLQPLPRIPARGKVHSHRSETSDKTTTHYATVRYALGVGENIYFFEREVRNKSLYNRVGRTVQLLVHPRFPRSGFPLEVVEHDLRANHCSCCCAPLIAGLAIWGYFALHSALYYTGSADLTLHGLAKAIDWVVTALAPLLIIPHARVLGEMVHRKRVKDFLTGAEVIHCTHRPRGARHPSDNSPSLEKAVRAPTVDLAGTEKMVKAVPMSWEDENRTVATEESTVVSADLHFIDDFVEDSPRSVDSGVDESGGELELV